MSDENQNPPFPPSGGTEDDGPDEPIRELQDLERDTTPGFLSSIRRKIYRRTAVSHVATFSWQIPKVILVEMVGMLGHILNAFGPRKGSER